MKTIQRILAIFFYLVGSSVVVSAQDIIFKKNKDAISAKVLEIGLDEIKYKPYNNIDGPTISISRDEVWKIKYENNSEWINAPDPYSVNSAVEVRDKSRAIKFEFFSPLFGKLAFGYEQMIKVGLNLEFKVGFIGPSISNSITTDNPSGVFFKAGPKFLLGSEHVHRGVKYTHQLFGKYFKPEIIFSTFKKDYISYNYVYPYGTYTSGSYRTTSYGVNLVFGKQSIIGKVLTLDWYFGLGYGGQSYGRKNNVGYENPDDFEEYCFSHGYGGPNFPMIYSAGLAIGILVK